MTEPPLRSPAPRAGGIAMALLLCAVLGRFAWPLSESHWTLLAGGAVLLIGIFCLAVPRAPLIRMAGLLFALVGLVDVSTSMLARWEKQSFIHRSEEHLEGVVANTRSEITATERVLDANLDRTVAAVSRAGPGPSRAVLFRIMHHSIGSASGRGALLQSVHEGDLAWWGEELHGSGLKEFEFDVTDLYVVRSRTMQRPGGDAWILRQFARFPNFRSDALQDDDWISTLRFHGGPLRLRSGSRRFLLLKRADSALWADLAPRRAAEVETRTLTDGADLSALLLALAAAIMLALVRRELRTVSTGRLLSDIGFILLVREALVSFTVDSDPERIFGFDIYGSRILGVFSKSPIDLLLTAIALFACGILLVPFLARQSARASLLVRGVLVAAISYGYVRIVENLASNSRVSAIPDHIVPSSIAQAVLLGSLLFLAFVIVQLTFNRGKMRDTMAGAAVAVLPSIIVLLLNDSVRAEAFAAVSIAAAVAMTVSCTLRQRSSRWFLSAALAVVVIFIPAAHFERSAVERFIAETYAPLVVGESGQLRTMIEDTLHNEFSEMELSNVLPDHFEETTLDDLAYALWLRSDLSKWHVPAVITIEGPSGETISRFGVGLPQFSERESTVGREVLEVGSLRRILIHHDFEVRVLGRPVGHGSVHVLNPADPGAETFADVYRDFFEASPDDSVLRTPLEPIVFDRNGNAGGSTTIRLPQSPASYFASLKPGAGHWIGPAAPDSAIYLRRTEGALYAFPVQVPTWWQQLRRAGGVTIWAIVFVAIALLIRHIGDIAAFLRHLPRNVDFRTRTSIYLTAVVVVPLIIFVLFVRAYLSARIEQQYLDRGQTALNTAQRVIEDYLASSSSSRPEQVLNDEILTWLARAIGHDLHLYRDEELIASSRRDLFAAHVESDWLPGDVYSAIVLRGMQLFKAARKSGPTQYIEIYSPINLTRGRSYTLALPFIVQGRQIESQVNDLATTIYMLLIFIVLGSIAVAFRTARTVTGPVQALVGGARAVAAGDFDYQLVVPSDPDLGLLVTTFRDMAQSIRRQQNDLRHERDRLQTLLENINAAVVVLDGSYEIVATNLAARRLFALGEQPAGRFNARFPQFVSFLASHQPGRPASEEIEGTLDSAPRTFRASIVPLPDSGEEMLIAEDVTEILRSNRLEAWGEMARQVAHEIKNPLTPIQLTAEHLKAMAERNDPNLASVVGTAVENILRQVVTLRETSREFSDYASLRRIKREPIDLRRTLHDLAADYSPSREHGINFVTAIDPHTPTNFPGDARLLNGALANLIENAFQAAGSGGTVELGSRVGSLSVTIFVKDSGPGISSDLLGKIFDPYFSTKSTGTGLGLAIARKAVEEHGGTITAENQPGGFCISVDLPMDVPDP
jgi:nitrogen fixation/metabolism regulation signal transduction histidine kinase